MRKIAVTGPESSGKSWLAGGLACHYNTVFVPEYARAYLQDLGREYTQDDLLQIAAGQYAAEQNTAARANDLLICDTDFLVLKIWFLHKYNYCPPFIINQLEKREYHLHLLCNIDLPWEYDPQREHPHLRQYFFDWYERELQNYGFPYKVVSGQGNLRLDSAISGIDCFFGYKV